MTFRRIDYKYQFWFINLLQGYGYQGNLGGMCYGVAQMAMQAALVDELAVFDERIQLLRCYDGSADLLKAHIDQAKEVIKLFPGKVPKAAQRYLDIQAFFDGIELYQLGYSKHKDIVDARSQDEGSGYLLPILTSQKITANNGKITTAAIIQGNFKKQNIAELLKQLARHAEESGKVSFSIGMSANAHAINVSYNPAKKQWVIMDANHLPSQVLNNPAIVAEQILSAFNFKKNNIEKMSINLRAAVNVHENNLNKNEIRTFKNKLQKFNKFSEWDPHQLYLQAEFLLAANDVDLFKQVYKKLGIDILLMLGNQLLIKACQHDSAEIAEFIINESKKSILMPKLNKHTLLKIAQESGSENVVSMLLRRGAVSKQKKQHGDVPSPESKESNPVVENPVVAPASRSATAKKSSFTARWNVLKDKVIDIDLGAPSEKITAYQSELASFAKKLAAGKSSNKRKIQKEITTILTYLNNIRVQKDRVDAIVRTNWYKPSDQKTSTGVDDKAMIDVSAMAKSVKITLEYVRTTWLSTILLQTILSQFQDKLDLITKEAQVKKGLSSQLKETQKQIKDLIIYVQTRITNDQKRLDVLAKLNKEIKTLNNPIIAIVKPAKSRIALIQALRSQLFVDRDKPVSDIIREWRATHETSLKSKKPRIQFWNKHKSVISDKFIDKLLKVAETTEIAEAHSTALKAK